MLSLFNRTKTKRSKRDMRTKRFVFETLALLVIVNIALTSCAPATEAPVTEMPAPEMPATEVSATKAPATEASAAGLNPELIAAARAEGMLTTIALPHDWCNYGEIIRV